MKSIHWLGGVCVAAALSGCASTGQDSNPQDPWEGFNRGVYQFNDTLDRYALKPIAQGYDTVTPDPVQDGVGNFFSNLGEIQLDPQQNVYSVEIGQVTIGEFLDFPIRIVNVGTADLTVSSIQFEYEEPTEGDTHEKAFVLESGVIEEPVVIAPVGGLDGSIGEDEHNLMVRLIIHRFIKTQRRILLLLGCTTMKMNY